ncbi:MAG: PA0069 family radical SAM protein [Pirellulales bacterium]|nr:PA0069 family radical SAM protein [Pirellulales bacterium]
MESSDGSKSHVVGRGAQIKPPNRFQSSRLEEDLEHLAELDQIEDQRRTVATRFLTDQSRSIITTNDSPDIPFRVSINPYRGCEHGCAYCYARPGHEYLGMNAGLDFETNVLVKHDAADLLRDALNKPSWRCEPISISGVTDCYQPAERRFKITRSILEVLSEANHPAGIITKNSLVARDQDLLASMAQRRLMHVFLSITTLDAELARRMEPRTATPDARLRTIEQLTSAGVPVGVMVAPIIPGLNDEEIAHVLSAARDAGAVSASYVLLRLPLAVEPVFRDWLDRNVPLKKDRIEGLIRSSRDGKLSDARFGSRMCGTGEYAKHLQQTFKVFRAKTGLDQRMPPQDTSQFRPPLPRSGQLNLF